MDWQRQIISTTKQATSIQLATVTTVGHSLRDPDLNTFIWLDHLVLDFWGGLSSEVLQYSQISLQTQT